MNTPTFPFTEDELKKIGFFDEGVPGYATQVLQTMKDHPELFKPSLFVLECIILQGQQYKGPSSLTLSDSSRLSNSSALTFASDTTFVSEYGPDAYEKASYYSGITGDGDHPELVYRSDYLTTPHPKPVGRFAHVPVKSVRGVFDTPLNKVWDVVGPGICDILKAREIKWSSIDTARFFTHGPLGEEEKGSLGPVVIWIGVLPGSTSPDTAHDVSQEILALLAKNEVDGVVVEWRESVVRRLAGPALMRHVNTPNPTHYVRRFLTALLGVPLTTKDMVGEDSQGTLTLWFHENKDSNGNPSTRVYGVSNCHVLRKNTAINYVHKGGACKDHVRVCSMHRFQRGLDEIFEAIVSAASCVEVITREVAKLQANADQDEEQASDLAQFQRQLDEKNQAILKLKTLYEDIKKYWSDMNFRNIGHVEYAPAIKVDQDDTKYTADWGTFLAEEAKVKEAFEGNVVDLGTKYSPIQLTNMFYPASNGPTTFKYPEGRRLRIFGCATKEELAIPAEFDNDGQRCLMVGKDGSATDLTVGRFSGLESFINTAGVVSREVAIYNSGHKGVEVFSDTGDSGSLVWHMKEGKAHIVGQLHSGTNKGGSVSNHVTYCTPGWYLLAEIKKKYKNADFYRTTWSA